MTDTPMSKIPTRPEEGADGAGYKTFKNENDEGDASEQAITVSETIEELGFGQFQILLTFMAGFCWLADGMEIMLLSILGPFLQCEWNLEPWEVALMTTVVFSGFLVGAPLFGFVADVAGRKRSLLISTVIGLIFGIACAMMPNLTWLLVMRFLVGFGVSGAPQAVTYCSEFMPNSHRGKIVILIQIFWAMGGITEVLLALLLVNSKTWRIWLGISALPLLVFIIFCLWLPESPRYDVSAGNQERALKTLQLIARLNGKKEPQGKLIEKKQLDRGRISDLLVPDLRMTSAILLGIWFISAFSYYGSVLLSTEMIRAGGTCAEPPQNATVCHVLDDSDYGDMLWTAFAELPGLFLTMLLVDTIGRKPSLYCEYLAYAVSCFLLFICMGRIPMIVILFVGRCFISSAFQVVYLYTPEVYPTNIRALSMGLGTGAARLGALVTPYVAEVLVKKSLRMPLAVYGSAGMIAVALSFFLPYETKGRKLDQS